MKLENTEELTSRQLLDLLGTGGQRADLVVPDMQVASRITAHIRTLREARGERIVGRKIGFSNQTIWATYNVDRPMWNYVWDTTLVDAHDGEARIDISLYAEPRIEPEIVLRLHRAPELGMNEAELLGCIDAVAHAFEIVQSVYPGWKFTAPQSAAAFGLHGALVLGPWQEIEGHRAECGADLREFTVHLRRNGELVDTGHAGNVLGGPVLALKSLVEALAAEPQGAAIAPGELVSTGTLTDAYPAVAGSVWTTEFHGIKVPGLRLICC